MARAPRRQNFFATLIFLRVLLALEAALYYNLSVKDNRDGKNVCKALSESGRQLKIPQGRSRVCAVGAVFRT